MIGDKPGLIHEDNQSTIAISKTSKHHVKAKHIDIKYHYVRDQIKEDNIIVQFCPTTKMVADIFTKGLPSERFCQLREMLGMQDQKF